MTDRRCAYCGSESRLTREHLWPQCLHLRLIAANDEKESVFWLARIGDEIRGEPKLRDVCGSCNNGYLSELDTYICGLFDKHFVHMPERFEYVTFEYDYHRLKRWLLKMCFNSARIHSSVDLIAFPPLLPYIKGNSPGLGRSVQMYVQLAYPGVVPEDFLAEAPETARPYIFRPIFNRVGHLWFDAHGVGRKLLRAVHLRAFSFYLAFFEPGEGNAAREDFAQEFTARGRALARLRASESKVSLICDGIDAWTSFSGSREGKFVSS